MTTEQKQGFRRYCGCPTLGLAISTQYSLTRAYGKGATIQESLDGDGFDVWVPEWLMQTHFDVLTRRAFG